MGEVITIACSRSAACMKPKSRWEQTSIQGVMWPDGASTTHACHTLLRNVQQLEKLLPGACRGMSVHCALRRLSARVRTRNDPEKHQTKLKPFKPHGLFTVTKYRTRTFASSSCKETISASFDSSFSWETRNMGIMKHHATGSIAFSLFPHPWWGVRTSARAHAQFKLSLPHAAVRKKKI